MIEELDDVILTCDLPEYGLSTGDIGTAVLVHRGAAGYEVEFTSLDGDTIAVVTLMANQVRPAQTGEIAHVRALTAARSTAGYCPPRQSSIRPSPACDQSPPARSPSSAPRL